MESFISSIAIYALSRESIWVLASLVNFLVSDDTSSQTEFIFEIDSYILLIILRRFSAILLKEVDKISISPLDFNETLFVKSPSDIFDAIDVRCDKGSVIPFVKNIVTPKIPNIIDIIPI